jgi:Xaa-Pro dipeptidase
MNRRIFLATSAAAALHAQTQTVPDPIKKLRPMTDGIQPITEAERSARREKARGLMLESRIGSLVMEGGSSMFYFTGMRLQQGAVVMPAEGEPVWVVPEAEASKLHGDVRTFGDDLYPALAKALRGTRIALEERVRFAVYDGLHKQSPALEIVSGDPVTIPCRVIKSPAEIALMQRANDITIEAYKAALATLHEGMTQRELSANISAAYQALGTRGNALVGFGKYTAFPHGSIETQMLREGDFVLIDDGCTIEGYQSDITRTVIFGKPSDRQRRVWDLERKAQDAALAAAQVGAACESVDAAARKVITDAGFGPDYKVPGLPHRTGHGIGLDGHEWTNFVRGNKTKIQPGMCFSDEPMIAIYGEFGVRLEDCLHITEAGPRMFTKQSPAIDQPFG